MSLSVVILTKNWCNLLPCVSAIRKHDPGVRIVVVDDGLPPNIEIAAPGMKVPGEKPFIFARNANIGIRACAPDDVILLNDDALLRFDVGFSRMHRDWMLSAPHLGLVSSSLNFPSGVVGNEEQLPVHPDTPLFRKANNNIAFVCVLIPRSVYDEVGPLDERFTAYGWEDNEYCDRVRAAGYSLGVYDGCFVDHSKLQSTFRSQIGWELQMQQGQQIYERVTNDRTSRGAGVAARH